MTVEINVQVNCDGCDIAYPADPRLTSDADALTAAAKADGWRTRVRRGEREDHCPECQEVIA